MEACWNTNPRSRHVNPKRNGRNDAKEGVPVLPSSVLPAFSTCIVSMIWSGAPANPSASLEILEMAAFSDLFIADRDAALNIDPPCVHLCIHAGLLSRTLWPNVKQTPRHDGARLDTPKPLMLHCLPHVTLRCISTRQADKVPLFKKKSNKAYLSGAMLCIYLCSCVL